jgi:hypothetical protein
MKRGILKRKISKRKNQIRKDTGKLMAVGIENDIIQTYDLILSILNN